MARFSPSQPNPRAASQRRARPRGRPPVISDDDILEVARAVFLERGIQATTDEVAERAGVSEGTVFRRFKSKDALFRAAMRFSPEAVPAFIEGFISEVGQGDLRDRLLHFATRVLELGRTAVPMMMMSWSNPCGDYHFDKMPQRMDGYRKTFRNVCHFFERELSARDLEAEKAELLARIFMGSLHHYCMAELFLGSSEISPSREDFTRGLVDVLLSAAGYKPQQPPPRRGKRSE
ncbi:MAG: TetR/AcrR family transcriptional regulator [Myxococcota bacterium]